MLVLSRKFGERVRIGAAEVTILRVGRDGVRLGIEAPESMKIVRSELPPPSDASVEDPPSDDPVAPLPRA